MIQLTEQQQCEIREAGWPPRAVEVNIRAAQSNTI